MDFADTHFVDWLNLLAIFVAAMSGATAGIQKDADIFGVITLAFATACSGGILRDILIGDLPPDNIKSAAPLIASFIGGGLAFCLSPRIRDSFQRPVQIFDAIGLGLFTALGADKALACGVIPVWAVLLGVVTGVGGGVVRDILLARTPTILLSEIYAAASLAGGTIIVLCSEFALMPRGWAMLWGAAVCVALRCLAIRYRWNIRIKAAESVRSTVKKRL